MNDKPLTRNFHFNRDRRDDTGVIAIIGCAAQWLGSFRPYDFLRPSGRHGFAGTVCWCEFLPKLIESGLIETSARIDQVCVRESRPQLIEPVGEQSHIVETLKVKSPMKD
jgi:hypothetical protein